VVTTVMPIGTVGFAPYRRLLVQQGTWAFCFALIALVESRGKLIYLAFFGGAAVIDYMGLGRRRGSPLNDLPELPPNAHVEDGLRSAFRMLFELYLSLVSATVLIGIFLPAVGVVGGGFALGLAASCLEAWLMVRRVERESGPIFIRLHGRWYFFGVRHRAAKYCVGPAGSSG
jgi:hypothetical protein